MKTKKLLAVALALIMLLSCMSITAFAIEPPLTVGEAYTYTLKNVTLVDDDTITGEDDNVKDLAVHDDWTDYIDITSVTQNGSNVDIVITPKENISATDATEKNLTITYKKWSEGDWKNNDFLSVSAIQPSVTLMKHDNVIFANTETDSTSVAGFLINGSNLTVSGYTCTVKVYKDNLGSVEETNITAIVKVGWGTTGVYISTNDKVSAGTYYLQATVTSTADETITAKSAFFPFVISPYFLDLDETTDTYLQSKDIDQKYTFKQTSATTYNDVSKVKLEWTVTDIAATYTSSKTWDPDTMSWTETKGSITGLDDHTATFKLTNYSSTKVVAKIAFTAETALKDSLSTATFKIGANTANESGVLIDTMVNPDRSVDATKKATVPSVTFDATLTFDTTEFAKLSEQTTTAKYGTYTVSIEKPIAVTFNMNQHGDAINAQYLVKGDKVTEPTEPSAIGFEFLGWFPNDDYREDSKWNFENDTVTADTVLCAKWSSNTYTVTLVPDHGKENSSVIATNGQAMPTLQGDQIPYDTAYEFLGYFDQQEGGNRYYNADGTSAQNYNLTTGTTLYAQWKELGQPE